MIVIFSKFFAKPHFCQLLATLPKMTPFYQNSLPMKTNRYDNNLLNLQSVIEDKIEKWSTISDSSIYHMLSMLPKEHYEEDDNLAIDPTIDDNEIEMEIENPEAVEEDELGSDLDVPGSELDDQQESVGSEDEENNFYSIGGDNHNDLEEDDAN